MADNSKTSNGGHINRGSTVTREDRPAGPTPMRRQTRLGAGVAVMDNPFGTGAVPKDVKVGNNGGKTY